MHLVIDRIKRISAPLLATVFLSTNVPNADAAEATRPFTNSDIAILGDGDKKPWLVLGAEDFRYRDSVPTLAKDSDQQTEQHTVSGSLALRVAEPLFLVGRYAYTNAELNLNLRGEHYTTTVDRKDSILGGARLIFDADAGSFSLQALVGAMIPRNYRTALSGAEVINEAPIEFDGMLQGTYLSPAQRFAVFIAVLRNAFDPFLLSLQDGHLPSLVNDVPTVVEANVKSHRVYLQQTEEGITEHPNGRRYLGSLDVFFPALAFSSNEYYAGLNGGLGYEIICPLNECGDEEIHRLMANGGAFFNLGPVQVSFGYNRRGDENFALLTLGAIAERKELFFGGRYIRPISDSRTEHVVLRAGIIKEKTKTGSHDDVDKGGSGGDLGEDDEGGGKKQTPAPVGGSEPPVARPVEITDLPAKLHGKNRKEITGILSVLEYDFNGLTVHVNWHKAINDLIDVGYLDSTKISGNAGPKSESMQKAVGDLQRTINGHLARGKLQYYYSGEVTTTPLKPDDLIGGRTSAAISAFLKFAINEIRAAHGMEPYD